MFAHNYLDNKMNLFDLHSVYISEPVATKVEEKNVSEFEKLISQERISIERFVRFKIFVKEDAEDILQNVYITAMQKFDQLKNKESFKAWIISIARNKCNDFFREKAKLLELPVEELIETKIMPGRHGFTEMQSVQETLEKLGEKEKQILYLYFWKEMSQEQIAEKLGVPLGTVKSRLHTAKQKFKENYYHEK